MNHNALVEKDRRLFKRYKLQKPCLVTGDNLVGLIKDLSCGGCSFQYVKKKGLDSDAALSRLGIEPLGMGEVQVEVVEDRSSIEEREHSFVTMHLRRVKFVGLSLLQMRSLQEYIRKRVEFSGEEKAEDLVSNKLSLLPPRATGSMAGASAACC